MPARLPGSALTYRLCSRTRPEIAIVSRLTTNTAAISGWVCSEVGDDPAKSTRSSPIWIDVTKPIAAAMTSDELPRPSRCHDVRSRATRKAIHADVRSVSAGDSIAT